MLVNDFYVITQQESGAEFIRATIDFQKGHPVFGGHFPGHPIVPGVCMIQIVREFMELVESKKLRIHTGENIKFLSIINPLQNSSVKVDIAFRLDTDTYAVQASLFSDQVTYFKFKGCFQVL